MDIHYGEKNGGLGEFEENIEFAEKDGIRISTTVSHNDTVAKTKTNSSPSTPPPVSFK